MPSTMTDGGFKALNPAPGIQYLWTLLAPTLTLIYPHAGIYLHVFRRKKIKVKTMESMTGWLLMALRHLEKEPQNMGFLARDLPLTRAYQPLSDLVKSKSFGGLERWLSG